MCNKCIHQPVCGKFQATGGHVKSCEHHKEERKGRWIDVRATPSVCRNNVSVVRCSKCEIYFCDLVNNHHYMYHYCPHCGADMRGVEVESLFDTVSNIDWSEKCE